MRRQLFCIVVILTIWVLGMLNCIEAEEKAIGTARSSLAVEVGKLELSRGDVISYWSGLDFKMSPDTLSGNSIISATFAQVITPNLALKFSIGQTKVDFKVDSKKNGEITLIPFIGAIEFRFSRSNRQLFPHMEIGIGYYRAKADFKELERRFQQIAAKPVNDWFLERTPIIEVESEVESKLAYHIGAGLEYVAAQNFALYGNAKYAFLGPQHLKVKVKSTDPDWNDYYPYDINLNSWWIFIGAKMSFSAF